MASIMRQTQPSNCYFLFIFFIYDICPIFLPYFLLPRRLHFLAANTQTHPRFFFFFFLISLNSPALCLTVELNKERQTWKREERGAPKRQRDTEAARASGNTKHYFWQPLRASPSVTLITIQLWEEGYSIRRSGTQPGSCSAAGQARTPPLSQVHAFFGAPLFLYLCNPRDK